MKIVLISDVHCRFHNIKIPKCDLLISCGDYSFRGTIDEVTDFHFWLNKQNAKYKISLQGNHELGVEKNFNLSKQTAELVCPGVIFIDEGLIKIEGYKIWCSAITPFFHNWAYNRHRGEDIKKHWDAIPDDTDILLSHGPAYGILDEVKGVTGPLGCEDLKNRIKELKNLKLHAYGHVHSGYGKVIIDDITYVNASICNEQFQPVNKPIVIKL